MAASNAAIEAIRGCEALWPGHARTFRAISHYRKYNRARRGELSRGDAVQDVPLGTVPSLSKPLTVPPLTKPLRESSPDAPGTNAQATLTEPTELCNEPMPERMRLALLRHEKHAREAQRAEAARAAAAAAASNKPTATDTEDAADTTLCAVLRSSAASGLPTLLVAGSYS